MLLQSVRLANMATQSYDISMRKSCVGIRVPARSCGPGKRVDTRSVIHSPPASRAEPPAIIFLADCCFHFYDQHKRKQKMLYREMSLWAPWTSFASRFDQEWCMLRSKLTAEERIFQFFLNINYTKVNGSLFYC